MPKPEDISGNIALLSFLAITNKRNEVINDAINWFEAGIAVFNFSNSDYRNRIAVPADQSGVDLVTKIFQEMDIDIVNLRTVKENDETRVYTEHVINDKKFELLIEEESEGTKKILNCLPYILNAVLSGQVLCVDELDSQLHPVLIRYIIELFTNKKINKHGAQIIFTTHDLANMNNEVYRRDEIWFVAKNNMQASQLYSLVELKDADGKSIRKDARFDKQYLEGKYGADPYLRKIIDWGE